MKDGEVKNKLSPAQVSVMRHKVTEPPYFGKYWDQFEPGTYSCVACDTVLFGSSDKFDSKSGWPTFRKPLNERNLEFKGNSGPDGKIELRCKKCKSHLGYVISGDQPYYRINSVCLNFEAEVILPIDTSKKDNPRGDAIAPQPEAPARPEFPLPPPAIALIDDTMTPGWSTGTVIAAVIAGALLGVGGAMWYTSPAADSSADTATTTPDTATSTFSIPTTTNDQEPDTIIRAPQTTEPDPQGAQTEPDTPIPAADEGATRAQ